MSRARDLADLAGAADAGTVTGQSLIINGDMAVAQRGSSFTAPSSGSYTLDRWKTIGSHNGAVDISQSTTAPPNFKNSLKIDVTTADTSLTSNQYYIIHQRIEGQNIAHLNYGSSDAKQVTISFWVRSNKTGTYHVELQTPDSEELARQYTIDAANTWEYKTLTWIPNTDYTIPEDNTLGLLVYWWLAAGDTFDGSPIATTWANNTNRLDGQTNFLDSTSNEFYLTGVKMEVGSTATPFVHESYAENLAKCHRYFFRVPIENNFEAHPMWNYFTNVASTRIPLGVVMRTAPTVLFEGSTNSATDWDVYYSGAFRSISNINAANITSDSFRVNISASGLASGGASGLYSRSATAGIVADAEL